MTRAGIATCVLRYENGHVMEKHHVMELFANRCSPDKDISVAIENVDLSCLQQRLDQPTLGEFHWERRGEGEGGRERRKVVAFQYTLAVNSTNSTCNHTAVHTHLPCGSSK